MIPGLVLVPLQECLSTLELHAAMGDGSCERNQRGRMDDGLQFLWECGGNSVGLLLAPDSPGESLSYPS